jgi:carboxylesterase type B
VPKSKRRESETWDWTIVSPLFHPVLAYTDSCTERAALRWINSNIHLFGGDKSKVSLFGESAGAISASLQLVSNGGNSEGLFRGLFSLSGAPIAVGSIRNGQKEFDLVAGLVGCTGADATLDCLRKVPYLRKSLPSDCDQH